MVLVVTQTGPRQVFVRPCTPAPLLMPEASNEELLNQPRADVGMAGVGDSMLCLTVLAMGLSVRD